MDESFEPKQPSWQDYWDMAMRRRWWLLGPFFLCGFLAFGVARLWPEQYRSEALILIEQQKVPEQYVTPNVVHDPQDRLQNMTQQILSRTRLRRLIEQFNLFPAERARLTMDEMIDKMRERIRIELVQAPGRSGALTAFRINFSAGSPRVAQQVTNELTSLFIEENLRARTQQSVSTTDFLQNQLEQARKDLAEQEERQRQYKMRFLGQLPEQQQSNLQILSSLEAQLRAGTDGLERAEQQKIYLESMQTEYQRMQRSFEERSQNALAAAAPERPSDAAIRDSKKQLTEMETKYTPRHPDVLRLKQQVGRLEAQAAAESEPAGGARTKPGAAGAAAGLEPASAEVQSRLKAVGSEIESHRKDSQEVRQRIRQFQARLDLTPVREQQLAEVSRSYENARQYYQSLLQKKLQSELATNLERRQQGEQFRILDPASLPQKASQPNRMSILLVGWALGIGAGLALTALLEITDKTLRTEIDVSQSIALPVLVHIPVLRSPAAEVQQRWYHGMELVGAALGVLISISVGLYTYWVN